MVDARITSLEISRPVEGGVEDLLRVTRELGKRYFPDDTSHAVAILPDQFGDTDVDSDARERPAAIIAGDSRFEVYGRIMLPLVHLAGPSDIVGGTIRRIRNKLETPGIANGVAKEIRRIGAENGQDQEKLEIKCGAIVVTHGPFRSGNELALVPRDDSIFIAESQVYMHAIREISDARRQLPFNLPSTPVIPIARMAPNATFSERDRLLRGIETYMAGKSLRLILGKALPPFVR